MKHLGAPPLVVLDDAKFKFGVLDILFCEVIRNLKVKEYISRLIRSNRHATNPLLQPYPEYLPEIFEHRKEIYLYQVPLYSTP